MAGGRQSKYTKAIGDAICDGVRLGLSFDAAAKAIGIPGSTAHDWYHSNPEFSESVHEAESECEQELLERIRNAIKDGARTVTVKERDGQHGFREETTTITDGVAYAKWMLPRINPQRWSERDRIDQIAQAKFRESIQYLMAVVSDSAKAEISTALLAAGLEVNANSAPAPATAQD